MVSDTALANKRKREATEESIMNDTSKSKLNDGFISGVTKLHDFFKAEKAEMR